MLPFLDRLDRSRNCLIAGCGGGFDVFVGVPLAIRLASRGQRFVFANLSFSALSESGAERIARGCWRIEPSAAELPYFPEKWLAEWLSRREIEAPVYGLARMGPLPLRTAYETVMSRHDIDLVVLVDGGTDSIAFGDEPGLGTPVEDFCSVVAAVGAAGDRCVLAALGFGIDHFHGVSHHAVLQNIAALARDGGYLGSFSLVPGTVEAEAFISLVDYANERQPRHRSIVANSIAAALRGEFGDYHPTPRTQDSELFINPLMSQYWCLEASVLATRMKFAPDLARVATFDEAAAVIERVREGLAIRSRRPLPL